LGQPVHLNFQPFDPLHCHLITIRLLAPFSCGRPVTLLATFSGLSSWTILFSFSALVSLTMKSFAHLLSQLSNGVSPLFVTELSPQS